jgi:hypothetical protein
VMQQTVQHRSRQCGIGALGGALGHPQSLGGEKSN